MNRLLVVIACVALTALSACKTVTAPTEVAQTPEQKAFALYGTFVVFEELAASVATDPTTPVEVKTVIKQSDATAKPAADALLASARQVIQIQAELAAGKTGTEKLEVANQRLLAWVTEAQPKILALQCAVNPKQKVCNETNNIQIKE